MIRFFSCLLSFIALFVFVYSCSAEEEDRPPPAALVKTPESDPPAPTQYTLTVTSGEGGTVSTEGGTYDKDTSITITASPLEGYEFVGWEGSNETGSELVISINSNISIQAIFNKVLTDDLISFYEKYRSQTNFDPNQTLALEALILGQKDVEAGNLQKAKNRIDNVFSELPLSDNNWWSISNNSHCTNCPINIGGPTGYYGLRMLNQIISLGDPKGKGTLNMTAVVASCAIVTRPTLPDLKPETVNLNVAPEILENDGRALRISTDLFRNWIRAITGGLEVNLTIYTLEDCSTTVDFRDNGSIIFTHPDTYSMVSKVPENIADNTDLWWVVAPSGVPGDGSGYNRHFISGGMGGYEGLPLILSADKWFTRKPEHMGDGGAYHEVELKAYMPQFFQHEFMHYLFSKWNEFGLEQTLHSWFDRSTWPADFEGKWEPDYYAEALKKRLLNADLPLDEGLKAPKKINFIDNEPSILVGEYNRLPIENDWHKVRVILENGSLRWINEADVSWSLEIINGELWAGDDCPYGTSKIPVISGSGSNVKSLIFNGEEYYRIN